VDAALCPFIGHFQLTSSLGHAPRAVVQLSSCYCPRPYLARGLITDHDGRDRTHRAAPDAWLSLTARPVYSVSCVADNARISEDLFFSLPLSNDSDTRSRVIN